MGETTFLAPPALVKLAGITDFTFYVSTTFDSLREDAINPVRFGGLKSTDVAAYTPSKRVDLSTDRELLTRLLGDHLRGRLRASPTQVISDEDVLEFVCALPSRQSAPEKLFGELEHNHLRLLGGGFSDWLTRRFCGWRSGDGCRSRAMGARRWWHVMQSGVSSTRRASTMGLVARSAWTYSSAPGGSSVRTMASSAGAGRFFGLRARSLATRQSTPSSLAAVPAACRAATTGMGLETVELRGAPERRNSARSLGRSKAPPAPSCELLWRILSVWTKVGGHGIAQQVHALFLDGFFGR